MSNVAIAPPRGFSGIFVGPDHSDYENDRIGFYRQFDRRPAVIARCANVEDVSLAVRHAREHQLEIAVRGGGHSMPGYSTTEGGILIDVSRVKGIEIDAERASARVLAGVTTGDFLPATVAHGLAPVSGWDPPPTHAGLALHGGRGPLTRRHGWASDHVRSARLVTADGTTITVSEDEHADLLFGLRGAGSNFGIATELEVDLVSIPPTVLAGNVFYDHAAIESVITGVLDGLEDGFSDALSVMIALLKGPDGKPLMMMKVVHSGEPEVARADIDRIRALAQPVQGEVARRPYVDYVMNEETMPVPRWEWAEYGAALAGADLAAALVAEAERLPVGANPEMPTCFVGVEPTGPGLERPTDLPTVIPRRAHSPLYCMSAWSSPSEDDERIRWTHETSERLRSEGVCNDVKSLNYNTVTGSPDVLKRVYGEDGYRALQRLKANYDPDNVFHRNHNVEPAV